MRKHVQLKQIQEKTFANKDKSEGEPKNYKGLRKRTKEGARVRGKFL